MSAIIPVVAKIQTGENVVEGGTAKCGDVTRDIEDTDPPHQGNAPLQEQSSEPLLSPVRFTSLHFLSTL